MMMVEFLGTLDRIRLSQCLRLVLIAFNHLLKMLLHCQLTRSPRDTSALNLASLFIVDDHRIVIFLLLVRRQSVVSRSLVKRRHICSLLCVQGLVLIKCQIKLEGLELFSCITS